jgi:hypothetical protein
MPVPSCGLLMAYPVTAVGADARPNWQERPERESLTAARWR